jgi:DNA mismatch repair ATPase MutS
VLAVLAVAVLVLALVGQLPWAAVLGVFVLNSAVHFGNRRRVDQLPVTQLGALLSAGGRLARAGDARLGELGSVLDRSAAATGALRRRLAPLLVDDGFGLVQYLKIYVLADVLAYRAVSARVAAARPRLQALHRSVGTLDALVAVASVAAHRNDLCEPAWTGDPAAARVAGARHPLLAEAVANDFDFAPPAAFITGSNMSGKTTFLKTLGVNAVLAQTVGLAAAGAWEMPMLRVLTSIGRADNLVTGRSYYLAEVESVRRLVEAAGGDALHLLIADEVFRGTNPDERVAGAAAVLRHLARGRHLVLAAAHDLELVGLLAGTYASYHFTDRVSADGLSFDYILRRGPSASRNAITLLEVMGYPAEVVADARRVLPELSG